VNEHSRKLRNAQAVPGPLFTLAAYLGTVMGRQPNGWAGAALCLVAMFLPSFQLVIGPTGSRPIHLRPIPTL
jgi:chromate transporter